EIEEEGISFPTLRRAKKALGVRSVKNGDTWDWQLPSPRIIPQPSPLLSLASLEHVQEHQAVSGGTQAVMGNTERAEDAQLLVPCGCRHAHAPGDCQAEVVENMEDVQDAHDEQAADEPPPASVRTMTPPMFCPRCHRRPTWLKRA